MSAAQRSFGDVAGAAVNRLPTGEGVMIRRGHGVDVMSVHIIEVVNARVETLTFRM